MVLILIICCMKFSLRFKIGELFEEHSHEILRIPSYHYHSNSIGLVWSQVKRYHNSNRDRNGFGNGSYVKQVCMFAFESWLQSRGFVCHM
jgi:transposase